MTDYFKPLFIFLLSFTLIGVNACSTNPATGKSQFAGLMSPQQENQIGSEEHQKIMAEFGEYNDPEIKAYVQAIGERVSRDTERPDVKYKFFVLDSPIVNAFALPGGYVYISRGLLALADNEAELSAVLAHEIGHITGRHSAERYSKGVVTSLGAAVLSAAVGQQGVSQALSLGANLYLSSYSRKQESEADSLGLRYMTNGGYDVSGMPSFLKSMQSHTTLEAQLDGKTAAQGTNYFSTHPATGDRVALTLSEARAYPAGGSVNRDAYLNKIDGIIYGDSARQGFIRGQSFIHPEIGLAFDAPQDFTIKNQPSHVVASNSNGAVIIFDMASNEGVKDPATYISQAWMKEDTVQNLQRTSVNGLPAATAQFKGTINGKAATILLMSIQWNDKTIARFQVAIPQNASASLIDGLKRSTYSLRRINAADKKAYAPYRVKIVTAKAGDTAQSLAEKQPFNTLSVDRFRILNGLSTRDQVVAGNRYKVITD